MNTSFSAARHLPAPLRWVALALLCVGLIPLGSGRVLSADRTVTFPAGAESVQLTVTPVADAVDDSWESVTVELLSDPGYLISGGQLAELWIQPLRPHGGDPGTGFPPKLLAFSPGQGGAGMVVTLTGSSFTDVTEVLFGGVSATFEVIDDGRMTARVPLGAVTGPIRVLNPWGVATSLVPFQVTFSGRYFKVAKTVIGGGTIDLKPALAEYPEGATIQVQAVPQPGWSLLRWQKDLAGTVALRDLTLDTNKVVEAVFAPGWSTALTNGVPVLEGKRAELPLSPVSAQAATLGFGWALKSGPEGLQVTPDGLLTWTPTESQGGQTFSVVVGLVGPGVADERSFTLAVQEENRPPTLGALTDRLVVTGDEVQFQMTGDDVDLPAQTLVFRLVSGPTNAVVSSTGAFRWKPLASQSPSTNRIEVAVSDGSLSVTNGFTIEVVDLVTLVNGQPVLDTVGILPPCTLGFRTSRPDWFVYYSLDGQRPDEFSNLYDTPVGLSQSATVWPILFSQDFGRSLVGVPVRVNVLKPQQITVTGGEGLVHLGPGIALGGVSSSGLSVVLSVVSGPARIEGGLLVPQGGGRVVIRASQAGDATWAPVQVEVERIVAPAAQTIVWKPVPAPTFGDAPLTLKAEASSGLPVVYEVVSGPGQVSGDRLTLSGAGQIGLRARQAGTADFAEATAPLTVTVAKASQVITFPALAARAYTPDAIPLVATSSSGLPVAFAVLSGPAEIQGASLGLKGVGSILIRAIQPGNGNFEAANPKEQTLVVTKAGQTLVFTPVGNRTFGEAPVRLVATSSGGLPVGFRVVSGPASVAGDLLTLLGAGAVVVEASQGGSDVYDAVKTTQSLTVAKAAQTITFPALPDVAYTTNPIPLSATSSRGLTVAYRVVTGSATVSGAQLRLGGVGLISVAAEHPGDDNHLPGAPVTNSFTVSRGVQTITFAPPGDQVLGGAAVVLGATSSAGLPIVFSVLSGPATIAGNQVTLLDEGTVTVRARQVGSPLWLPAQVEQSFVVRKLTSLAVTVVGGKGGSVQISPVKDLYAPTDTVTLTAAAIDGFGFGGWGGDLAGSQNPATVVMSANRKITALFNDVGRPVLTWETPVGGITGDEQVVLSGKATDNVGITEATWRREGGPSRVLPLASDGGFRVEGLVLDVGTNVFEVRLRDEAGNVTADQRTVVWVPERVLRVATAAEVQEGQRVVYPVQLVTDAANVAGLTFRLRYDPAQLADPQVEWGALVGQSVNNLNLTTPGEIAGSFALAGTSLPAGTNPVATVSFRARSVPGPTNSTVAPSIVSIGTPSGTALTRGNAVVAGQALIRPRRIKGDNNANQRIDIGDAVVISRLEVGLEERRTWDIGLNDLNNNQILDNGDIIKALRYVVGLDAQPKAAPRSGGESEWSVESGVLRGEGVAGAEVQEGVGPGVEWALSRPVLQGTAAPTDLRPVASGRGRLRPAGSNTNDVATLEFPDGPVAQVGKPYRVVVKLTRASAAIAGLSFTVNYPSALTLTDKQVGALVPADALPLWAESVGSVNLAAVRSTIWPTSTGVAAVLTFLPTAAINAQAAWPIELVKAEVTGAGFDIRALDSVTGEIRSSSTPPTEPKVVVPTLPTEGGPLALDVEAAAGAAIVLETTTDLGSWSEAQRLTGQGAGKPVRVTVMPDPNARVRFWRVRVP